MPGNRGTEYSSIIVGRLYCRSVCYKLRTAEKVYVIDKYCKVWNFIPILNKSRRFILRNEGSERQETYEGRKKKVSR
jgi:hypothetical protein